VPHIITPNALAPESRLRRSRGRGARASCVSSRVTEEELRCLESEWAREVLLEAARRTGPDVVLVELVATRMLLVNMLKMIGQTRALPEAEYTKIHTEVQKVKRRIARELAEQTERLNTTKES
jgi:hypothetical protein